MKPYWAIAMRDLALAFRSGGSGLQAVAFFALTVLLFALAVGPDIELMKRIAGPVLWTGALLATLSRWIKSTARTEKMVRSMF